jgi:drug/metabolite transporter (DMT)-like permease
MGTFLSTVSGFTVALTAALIFEFRALISLPPQAIFWFAMAGILSQAVGRYLNYSGLKRLGASRNAPLAGTSPFYSALLAVVFLDETINLPIIGGILILISGIYFLTSGGPAVTGGKGWEYIFPLGAAACWATTSIFVKVGVSGLGSPPLAGVPVALFFASLMLVLPARKDFSTSMAGNRRGIGFLVLAGVASSLAVISQYSALSRLPVVIANPLLNTHPLVALLLSHLFLRQSEKITRRIVLGAFLVVMGVVSVTMGRH